MADATLETVIKAHDQFSKVLNNYQAKLKDGSSAQDKFGKSAKDMNKEIGFSIGNISQAAIAFAALRSSIGSLSDSTIRATNALTGLKSISLSLGQDYKKVEQAARKLSSDGLMPLSDSVLALENLLQAGFGLDKSVQLIEAFKNSAAFGRQSALDFGYAIVSATEGIRNGNNLLIDNAGVTKNLSVIWKEYAKTLGKTEDSLTEAEKKQATFTGIIKETRHQMGDAAKFANTYGGQVEKLKSQFESLKASLGDSLLPILRTVATVMGKVIGVFASLPQPIKKVGVEIALMIGIVVALQKAFRLLGITSIASFREMALAAVTSSRVIKSTLIGLGIVGGMEVFSALTDTADIEEKSQKKIDELQRLLGVKRMEKEKKQQPILDPKKQSEALKNNIEGLSQLVEMYKGLSDIQNLNKNVVDSSVLSLEKLQSQLTNIVATADTSTEAWKDNIKEIRALGASIVVAIKRFESLKIVKREATKKDTIFDEFLMPSGIGSLNQVTQASQEIEQTWDQISNSIDSSVQNIGNLANVTENDLVKSLGNALNIVNDMRKSFEAIQEAQALGGIVGGLGIAGGIAGIIGGVLSIISLFKPKEESEKKSEQVQEKILGLLELQTRELEKQEDIYNGLTKDQTRANTIQRETLKTINEQSNVINAIIADIYDLQRAPTPVGKISGLVGGEDPGRFKELELNTKRINFINFMREGFNDISKVDLSRALEFFNSLDEAAQNDEKFQAIFKSYKEFAILQAQQQSKQYELALRLQGQTFSTRGTAEQIGTAGRRLAEVKEMRDYQLKLARQIGNRESENFKTAMQLANEYNEQANLLKKQLDLFSGIIPSGKTLLEVNTDRIELAKIELDIMKKANISLDKQAEQNENIKGLIQDRFDLMRDELEFNIQMEKEGFTATKDKIDQYKLLAQQIMANTELAQSEKEKQLRALALTLKGLEKEIQQGTELDTTISATTKEVRVEVPKIQNITQTFNVDQRGQIVTTTDLENWFDRMLKPFIIGQINQLRDQTGGNI